MLGLCTQKQLSCRILVKVIPHSVALISSSEEGGGGNRISEDQIKSYLDGALGEAPRPLWGLPGGWGDYCASRPPSLRKHMACIIEYQLEAWIGGMHCFLQHSPATAYPISKRKASSCKPQLRMIQRAVLDMSISIKTFATFPAYSLSSPEWLLSHA